MLLLSHNYSPPESAWFPAFPPEQHRHDGGAGAWLHTVLKCNAGIWWFLCVTTIPQISTLLTNNRERQSAGIKRAVSAIKAPGPNGPIDVSLVETPLNSYILFYICVFSSIF